MPDGGLGSSCFMEREKQRNSIEIELKLRTLSGMAEQWVFPLSKDLELSDLESFF